MISPYEGDAPFIFISYSHRDTAVALQIIGKLQELGYAVWYDRGITPGSVWDDNIAEHIKRCDYFIALISQAYSESEICKVELKYAISKSRFYLLVYLEDIELTGGLEMWLSFHQAIYRSQYNTEMDFLQELTRTEGLSVCKGSKTNESQNEEKAGKPQEAAESVESLLRECRNYDRSGNVAKLHGKLDNANEWYLKACTIREQIVKDTGTARARRDLSVSYEKLGNVAQALKELNDASEFYQEAFCLREELVDEVGTAQAQRDLSVSCRNLGEVALLQSHLEDAEKWYRRALSISEKLMEENRTAQACRDLSIDYVGLGDVAQCLGNLQKAEEWYQKGRELREELAEETGSIRALRDLSISYYKLGVHSYKIGNPEEANCYLTKSMDVLKKAAKMGDFPQYMNDLNRIRNMLNKVRYEFL